MSEEINSISVHAEDRNCDNCKWKSKEHSYPDWQKHTRKCINFPHNDFIDWEPIEKESE